MSDGPTRDDELTARNRELEAIFRAIPDLLFELSPDGRFVSYRSGRDTDLFVAPDVFLGKQVSEVLPPGPSAMVYAALARVAAGESHVAYEYDLPMPGETKWYEARVVPVEGGNTIVMVRDITDRHRAQDERLQLERKMLESQRLESLGVLAGGIAHDFNNLLAAIVGGAELVARVLPESSPLRGQIDIVRQAAWRASELSRQLLAYAGKGTVQRKHVDLASLVRDTAQLLEAAISKRVHLVLDLASDVRAVYADVGQLRQVLMNLITNASDALGDREGRITVRLRSAEHVAADSVLPKSYTELEVEDDGCGMDDSTRLRMFDPFFTTKGPGRGLGLAAVVGIVRAHDGRLDVASTVDHGTRVTVALPGSDGVGLEITRTEAPDPTLAKATVLVADDEPAVRDVVAQLLRDAGLTVIVAVDGRDAVERFDQHGSIELAVIDMTMPHLRGDEVFVELRKRDPDLAVILTSGYDEAEMLQRVSESERAPEFVAKPFAVTTMLAAVKTAFAHRAEWKRGRR